MLPALHGRDARRRAPVERASVGINRFDRLIGALWDADFAAESNIVEVYVRSLRRKVDEGRRDGLIETVRRSGYRLRSGESD